MMHHMLKLIWKRKSRNLLLTLEIALAFMVVFALCAFATRLAQLYAAPLGFDFANVWSVQIQVAEYSEVKDKPELLEQIQRNVQALPQVDSVALVSYSPFSSSQNWTSFQVPGSNRTVGTSVVAVNDAYFKTMNMQWVEGRAFGEADAGSDITPVVVNQRMARELFGDKLVLGQAFHFQTGEHDPASTGPQFGQPGRRYKITGVVQDYRDNGEFMSPANFTLTRYAPQVSGNPPLSMVVKLKPGTPRAFEAKLIESLKQVRSHWSYQIAPLADLRADTLKMVFVPLTVASVIAGFLLVMVAFGLFGVLWQNTTQRIPEIGLRRALGATAANIYWHIVAEQLLVSGFAMALALLLLLQLPLTGVLGESLSWGVFGLATAVSMALMCALSCLCSLYPGWRASQLAPREALHHE